MSDTSESALTTSESKPPLELSSDHRQIILPPVKHQPPLLKNTPTKKQDTKKKRYRRYLKLQVILWSVFAVGLLSSFLFLIASLTDDWTIMIPPEPYFVSTERKFMLEWRRGLWRDCMLEYYNMTARDPYTVWQCTGRDFFPTSETIEADDETDHYILDYERSIAAFAVITLVISSMPIFFTWYSIKEPRYIFKRLAGGLYFITAGCAIVCIEVFKHFLAYGRRYLPNSLMRLADYERGYSYYLGCIAVGLYILAGIVIFIVSGKKKGSNARSMKEAVENEPVIIGRI
ncbi:hypothetical protein HELRODRAFT_94914 [Helobdella robusta]|uniref:Uncharacterized protein n=1 Tax=Helobdella robusta TaxID=6412 RepID=T1G938_HELRO|nr:hypothetical protein HELRODRAFT_94914 [Helobdella robusta]ESN98804.1 hypothetical protein HELRODRAFT_94914 [Helobdella robusta]